MIRTISAVIIFLSLFNYTFLYSQTIVPMQSGRNTSIRGLSVLNDSIAWVSGSMGWTAKSLDRGRSWTWKQIKGYEKLDFRDIEAFSASGAILVSAGTPAIILLTTDGGAVWQEVYRNDSPDIFLDGMDFWDSERGIVYGDPVKGKMVLLQTTDSGRTWQNTSDRNLLTLPEGEASFAASGTAIRCGKGGRTWIATGGIQSRIFYSHDYGRKWMAFECPIVHGKNSTGPFSLAFYNNRTGVAAGGDYLADTARQNNLVLTKNAGKTWSRPYISTFGYRSAIEYISRKFLIATGPTGTDLSKDGGKNWRKLSLDGYHTVRKSKSGRWVLLTGGNGKISALQY